MAIGKNIKGITIEFNGDTSQLGKAIGEIDKKTRTLDSQLKQVNKSLKFNPGNTELIAQKQQLLGQKVDETKKRLEALKRAQAKLDDDPAVDKTSQDYMALRREIIETESKLKHFEGQLKALNNIKFEQVGKQVQDVGNKMKTVGDGMSKYVTAPLVGGAAASVKAWQEVDNGLDIVTQKTGASGKALEGMQQSVKNLTQSIPTDFETAGSAVGEVNTRFGLTGQALEDLSGKFIKFSQLNDTDVSSSIDSVQKAMTAYGLTADDAGGFLDVLNKVGQDTGISMDTLTDSMMNNAATLQSMGFDAEQAAFFVGQLEKSGVDSSAAMTGLQKALVNGAKEGKSMGQVLSEVQGSIVNAGSDTEALAAATEIFGAKAAPKLSSALRNGSLDLEALASASTDAKGNLESTFNETLDPADKFTMMLNSLKITGYEIADSMFTLLAPALEKVSVWLKNLADKWTGLSPGMQGFILKAAGILAVIGPVLSIVGRMTIGIGGLISTLPKLISGFGGVMKAFSVLSKVLLTNPWGLVAMAAIAAIVLIVKHWDQIKAFFSKLWTSIKNVASSAWNGIKNAIVTPIQNAIIRVRTFLMTMRMNFARILNELKHNVTERFNAIKNAMLKPVRAARDAIKKIIDKIKGFFNFDFELPHIKLPHFGISPKGWSIGDLLHGEIPSLDIEWYKDGAIFTRPTIIGNKGFGEAGAEAALPLEVLWKEMDGMFIRMADSIVNGVGQSLALQQAGLAGEITIPIYLYPSGPKMGEETVKAYDTYKKILG